MKLIIIIKKVVLPIQKEEHILESYLKDKDLKLTSQRKLILDRFLSQEEHVSAEELYDQLKQDQPNIGLATVYRTLKLFQECGLANEVHFTDGITRYEHSFGHDHHDHLVCIKCGAYIEVVDPEIENLQHRLAVENRFKVLSHRMVLYGICSDCQKH